MDQNRDGFIDKADLRDTFAALGKLVVIIKYLKETVVCTGISWGNNKVQKAKGNLFSLIFLLYGSCYLDYAAPAGKSPEQPLPDAHKLETKTPESPQPTLSINAHKMKQRVEVNKLSIL